MMAAIMVGMIILTLLLVIVGYLLASFALRIRRRPLAEVRKWQEEHYDLSWYDGWEKENYTVPSFDDYILHVQRLVNPAETGRYVLISHGYSDNRFGALKYAKMYLDLGFHVIVYDLRGHGENEKTFCTYSIREGKDLDVLIRDSRTRYPDVSVFGIHGESLGAAASVSCLQYGPQVDFAVSDCAFSEILSVMKGVMRAAGHSEKLVEAASIFDKIWYGYMPDEMRPIDALKENKIPMLFLHGEQDKLVVPEHSEKLSRETQGYRELYLIPGAGHAESVIIAPDLYRQHVESFLENIGVLNPAVPEEQGQTPEETC